MLNDSKSMNMSQIPNIRYITPYSLTKNFGGAINEECDRAGKDDWICLRDGDTMFLRPNWGQKIADAIYLHGDHFQLMGCMMNRLNDTHQLYGGRFSDNPDIRDHIN